ncbi:ankyrin [Ascodesmis nigricans]|uniref:Ankyrin n=1 Tax=Ascodesmis nigricans TaxID=341454 RepID=A0A4S2MPD6_9PEZI|nr:ankyrin [Ascodesmis nigricans]
MPPTLETLPLSILHQISYYLPTPTTVTHLLENPDLTGPPLSQSLPLLNLTSLSHLTRTSRTLSTLLFPLLLSTAASDLILTHAVETHLHRAASSGSNLSIRHLLHHRPTAIKSLLLIDHHTSHRTYRRPITCAAASNHITTVSLLHQLGDSPTEPDSNILGIGSLNHAAFHGHRDVCHLLVALVGGYNEGYNTPEYQHTPLFWAAVKGHEEVVRYLLSIGADANAETQDGENVLHWLAKQPADFLSDTTRPYGTQHQHGERVESMAGLLISTGCDPTLVAQLDPGKQVFETPLSLALRSGNIPVSRALLGVGRVDPNTPFAEEDIQGDRALHYLSRHPPEELEGAYRNEWIYTALFVLILQHGGKLNAVNRRGYTPLLVAVRELNYTAVRVLLEHGADPGRKTRKGKGVLQIVIEGWREKVDGGDGEEGEVLHEELMSKDEKRTREERRRRATVEAERVMGELVQVVEGAWVDEGGRWGTPLMVAVRKEAVWAVDFLLRIGANPDLPDTKGITPRTAANHGGNTEIIALFNTPASIPPTVSIPPITTITTTTSHLSLPSTNSHLGPPPLPPSLISAITTHWKTYTTRITNHLEENTKLRRLGNAREEDKGEWVWAESYGCYDPRERVYRYTYADGDGEGEGGGEEYGEGKEMEEMEEMGEMEGMEEMEEMEGI